MQSYKISLYIQAWPYSISFFDVFTESNSNKYTNKTVNVSYLNVRAGADKNSAIIGVLKKGDVIAITDVVQGWNKFTYEGKPAYVDGNFLTTGATTTTTTTQQTTSNVSTSSLKNPKTPATTDKIYNVSAGETIFTIAVNYYGNASYGKYLVEYNKEVVSNNGSSVKAGMELYLPEYLNGQKRFVDLSSDSNGYVYTFKSNDTLYSLAKEQYGNGKYCTVIYEANKDRLKSVSLVYTGQKIYIPYSIS